MGLGSRPAAAYRAKRLACLTHLLLEILQPTSLTTYAERAVTNKRQREDKIVCGLDDAEVFSRQISSIIVRQRDSVKIERVFSR